MCLAKKTQHRTGGEPRTRNPLILSPALYNAINVYCRELAPGAVSLTGDRAQGDDNKHCRDYTTVLPLARSNDNITG